MPDYECEEGGKYVGAAFSIRERKRRQGEMFPGLP